MKNHTTHFLQVRRTDGSSRCSGSVTAWTAVDHQRAVIPRTHAARSASNLLRNPSLRCPVPWITCSWKAGPSANDHFGTGLNNVRSRDQINNATAQPSIPDAPCPWIIHPRFFFKKKNLRRISRKSQRASQWPPTAKHGFSLTRTKAQGTFACCPGHGNFDFSAST